MRTWVPVVWERLMPCSINNNSSKWLQNSFALLPYPIHYRDKKQKQKLYGKVCICWKNVGEVTSCWNFPANFAVYITFQSNILPKATFLPRFDAPSFFFWFLSYLLCFAVVLSLLLNGFSGDWYPAFLFDFVTEFSSRSLATCSMYKCTRFFPRLNSTFSDSCTLMTTNN